MSPRLQWVDCGKGIGIVLVVFGHVLAGTHGAGILGDALFSYTYSFVYGFHMPLFFFLSGLFVERSLARGTGPYFRSKLWSVVYPYVLWSLAIGTVNIALAGQTNTAPDLARLLAIWHQPVKGFWFLYALFGCFALYWALSRLPARAHFAVALAICAAQPWIYWGPSLVDKFWPTTYSLQPARCSCASAAAGRSNCNPRRWRSPLWRSLPPRRCTWRSRSRRP